VRYDALGEDVEGSMGMKQKAYMDSRVKLLESGGKVINGTGTGGQKKWQAKAERKGFNTGDDFVEKGEKKKKRQKTSDDDE
jgi:hypothetical protein